MGTYQCRQPLLPCERLDALTCFSFRFPHVDKGKTIKYSVILIVAKGIHETAETNY